MKKVILAFSGGLDTSFCTIYLKEQGYDVVTVTVNTGKFTKDQLKAIEEKAMQLGSNKHYEIDATQTIYDTIIQYVIKLNGLYEDEYPLMCADRYVIAEEILKIAKAEGAGFVAHGSTAVGNDQVRFDATFLTLQPDIVVITPIKELSISRDEEIEFLKQKGFEVESVQGKYSVNENIFGVTVSGSEIDENKEPDGSAYTMTASKEQTSPLYLTLEFENGVPTKLDGKAYSGIELLSILNETVGSYGYGSNIYIGDCIIGIKGRIMFEAPGLLTLVKAHRKLEQLTLTKKQLEFNKFASSYWSDLIYGGLFHEPLTRNIEAYIDSVQTRVSGTVKIKVEKNKISIVEVASPSSMVNEKVAMYAQRSGWGLVEANGFIQLHSMQQRLAKK